MTAVRPRLQSSRLVTVAAFLGVCLPLNASIDRAQPQQELRVYFVDVEGGQSTLFVTPTGQSLLIDTGWADNDGRDADRIVAAARNAGISKLDYVLLTHFHVDHAGGVPQLAARIPIGTFIDHGPNRESTDGSTAQVDSAYRQLLATGKFKHIVAKPGYVLTIGGMRAAVVSADAATLDSPLPGAGQTNPYCKGAAHYPRDESENRRSLGVALTFGKLRILDLGDLTSDQESELMCPVNKLGTFDVYVVSHHGSATSGSPLFINAIAPRVAIMDNGAAKGANPAAWSIIEKSPRLENLWQLHFATDGSAHNVPAGFIANADGPDAGNYIELIGRPSGSFAVFNARTHKTVEYAVR